MARRRNAKLQPNTSASRDNAASLFVVAVADANPMGLLVSALTLRSQSPTMPMRLKIVAAGMRVKVVVRVAELLRARDIDVELSEIPGFKTWTAREDALRAYCAQAPPAPEARRVIDISGASSEMALRLWQIAGEQWGNGALEVVSYELGRNSLRVFGSPGDAPEGRIVNAIDIGNHKIGQPAVSVRDFLGAFNLTVGYENPCGADRADPEAASLLSAAVGILSASRDEPHQYATCRQTLADITRQYDSARITAADVPRAMVDTLWQLSKAGLVDPAPESGPGIYTINPPWDKGGAFFLRGGWLEILVGHALRGGFGSDHKVELNVGTAWGDGGPWGGTYAEADAVFLYRNRLYVVSCKNEHDHDRLRAHLD